MNSANNNSTKFMRAALGGLLLTLPQARLAEDDGILKGAEQGLGRCGHGY